MTVTLLDNGQPDPGPTNWTLAWSDEFSGTLGAAPNPANWKFDIGGSGWGNNEWEYYTDSRDNSALDGNGNLVIKAITNTNPAYTCTSSSPTGPGGQCYATSARMLSAGKQEFAYGRVEARMRIPKGQGIWPAFWMLGNDIFTTNPWPASGEIDIMENIGKVDEQTKVYGTIHGPGYSGGSGIGRSYDVSPTVLADDYPPVCHRMGTDRDSLVPGRLQLLHRDRSDDPGGNGLGLRSPVLHHHEHRGGRQLARLSRCDDDAAADDDGGLRARLSSA